MIISIDSLKFFDKIQHSFLVVIIIVIIIIIISLIYKWNGIFDPTKSFYEKSIAE